LTCETGVSGLSDNRFSFYVSPVWRIEFFSRSSGSMTAARPVSCVHRRIGVVSRGRIHAARWRDESRPYNLDSVVGQSEESPTHSETTHVLHKPRPHLLYHRSCGESAVCGKRGLLDNNPAQAAGRPAKQAGRATDWFRLMMVWRRVATRP
jgi:hypothetical protein